MIGFHQTPAAGVFGTWEALATNRSCTSDTPVHRCLFLRPHSVCNVHPAPVEPAINQWVDGLCTFPARIPRSPLLGHPCARRLRVVSRERFCPPPLRFGTDSWVLGAVRRCQSL